MKVPDDARPPGQLAILGRITSINVRKVTWVADLIGISYRTEVWGLPHRDPREAEFLKLNPNAQVPVILDDGFVLWESNSIMRYLARKHRSGLWPADMKARALVDQWLTWQATELNPRWSYAVQALLRKNPAYTDEARIKDSVAGWTVGMRILEAQLAGSGGFVTGGQLSLADVAMALSSHRWFSMPFERPELPAVKAHYEMMRATPEGVKYASAETP
jgi:glutathione S-transferase